MTAQELLEKYAKGERDFRGVSLSGANLSRANLTGAILTGAYLTGANLSYAYLSYAYLTRANLTGAYLSGANLSRAYLTGAILTGACLPENVTFEEFQNDVIPALFSAGNGCNAEGWDCHTWENCPMHQVFGINSESDAPPQWRIWVTRFVQLFDAKLLQRPACLKP